MTESFAELFEESLDALEMTTGAIVSAEVISIDNDFIIVNAGLKSEGSIPREQFLDVNGELTVNIGDQVKVSLEAVEDGYGITRLSRDKAKRAETWAQLEAAFEADEVVNGVISQAVRGGFTVFLDNVQAFLPGSLLDIRPLRDSSHLLNKELQFKLVKLDAKRNNIVVSRKAVLAAEFEEERSKLLEALSVGAVVPGVVKNLTDYGAFIDLGGMDGLLHITDMAWKRVKHPSELLNVGDEIQVKVIRYDQEKGRVSLGLKQLGEDPWASKISKYPVGTKVAAKVTNLMDYGCFAEIESGVEGLVHMSEMDWTNKNVQPSKVVQIGDQVEVMVLAVDQERRRISLGMKQCRDNPWQTFAAEHQPGERYTGTVRSITDFGLFVSLAGNIDGLVHVSDLSWQESGEQALKQYNKGDLIETVILSVDLERERVALGIKQLNEDRFAAFLSRTAKGDIVSGKVLSVDDQLVEVGLAEDVTGSVKLSEFAASLPSVGDEVEAVLVSVDKRQRQLTLSMKQLSDRQEKATLDELKQKTVKAAGPTTIGDLIKAQLEKNS